MPGHGLEIADAEQAYIQTDLKGAETWVCLPWEARADEMNKSKWVRPVVRLTKALYGHPDRGTFWEDHCDKESRTVGFKPIGPTWPSCYFHQKLDIALVIHVVDFKLAGPRKNLKLGWEFLRKGLRVDPETGRIHGLC